MLGLDGVEQAGIGARLGVIRLYLGLLEVRGMMRVVIRVWVRVRVRVRVRVWVRVRYFVATRGHKGVLCVRQRCGRTR